MNPNNEIELRKFQTMVRKHVGKLFKITSSSLCAYDSRGRIREIKDCPTFVLCNLYSYLDDVEITKMIPGNDGDVHPNMAPAWDNLYTVVIEMLIGDEVYYLWMFTTSFNHRECCDAYISSSIFESLTSDD